MYIALIIFIYEKFKKLIQNCVYIMRFGRLSVNYLNDVFFLFVGAYQSFGKNTTWIRNAIGIANPIVTVCVWEFVDWLLHSLLCELSFYVVNDDDDDDDRNNDGNV